MALGIESSDAYGSGELLNPLAGIDTKSVASAKTENGKGTEADAIGTLTA